MLSDPDIPDADLDTALRSPAREVATRVLVDWFRDGNWAELIVTEVSVERSLTAELPETVSRVVGYAAAQSRVTVTSAPDGSAASWYYSPANPSTPLFGNILGAPVLVQWSIETSAGTAVLTLLTGYVDVVSVDGDSRTATLTVLDGRADLRDLVQLPPIYDGYGIFFPRWGLDSLWVANRMLRSGGYHSVPPPRDDERLAVSGQGSAWTETFDDNTYPTGGAWTGFVNYWSSVERLRSPFGEGMRPQGQLSFVAMSTAHLEYPYTLDIEGWFTTGGQVDIPLVHVGGDGTQDAVRFVVHTDGRLAIWVSRYDTSQTDNFFDNGWAFDLNPGYGWNYLAVRCVFLSTGETDVWGRMNGTTGSMGTVPAATASPDNNPLTTSAFLGSAADAPGTNGAVMTATRSPIAFCGVLIHNPQSTGSAEPTWWNDGWVSQTRYDHTLMPLRGIPTTDYLDPWLAIQNVAGAEFGFAGLDEGGTPFYRNRRHLDIRGESKTAVRTIDDDALIGLTLSSVNDQYTSVETNVTPHILSPASYVWQASVAYELDGNLSIRAAAGKPVFTMDPSFSRVATNDPDPSGGNPGPGGTTVFDSLYRANTNDDGSGTDIAATINFAPANDGGTITSPTTGGYLVGTTGQPALWLHGYAIESRAADTVTVGNPTGRSLQLASTPWRQHSRELMPILQSILDQVQDPSTVVESVEIVPDPRLQLSDRVHVSSQSTGLEADYHIIGNNLGRGSQRLTLRQAIAPYDPLTVSGLLYWFDASDPFADGTTPAEGASISSWTDVVSNTSVTQATAANQPTWHASQTLFGKAAVRFDGVDDTLFGTTSVVPDAKTVIAITRTRGRGTGFTCFLGGRAASTDSRWTFQTGPTDYTFQSITYYSGANSDTTYPVIGAEFIITTVVHDASGFSHTYVNGVGPRTVDQGGVAPTERLCIGALTLTGGVRDYWDGDASAFIVFDRPLSDTERVSLEQYLAMIYGGIA